MGTTRGHRSCPRVLFMAKDRASKPTACGDLTDLTDGTDPDPDASQGTSDSDASFPGERSSRQAGRSDGRIGPGFGTESIKMKPETGDQHPRTESLVTLATCVVIF